MKNSVKLIFASALLLTAASCAKDTRPGASGEDPVRFDVGVDGTKATLVNKEDETAFTTGGFSVIAYEGSTKKMDNVAVTWSGTAWTYTGDCLWKKGTAMMFFGYYPNDLATALYNKTTKDGISTFTYSPLKSGTTTVKGQTDYMLATYSGDGTSSGQVSLKFTHPLASVAFKVGTFYSGVTINSIAIGGFYTSATCAPTANNDGCTYVWSSQSGTAADGALEQGSLNLTPTTDAPIGAPFVLIPQGFSPSTPLTVLLTITENSVTKTLLATITSGTLEQGKTTTYTINYTDKELTITSSDLTAYGENTDDDIFQTGTDPYWVDLGMVSDNGTKLLIARHDVKEIIDGKVVFDMEDTGTYHSFKVSDYEGGLLDPNEFECRPISVNEALSLSIPHNFNVTSEGNTIIFKEKINNPSLGQVSFLNIFPSGYGYCLLNEVNTKFSPNFSTENYKNVINDAFGEEGALRLVHDTGETVSIANYKLYYNTGIAKWYNFTQSEVYSTPLYVSSSITLRPVLVYKKESGYEYPDCKGITGKINYSNITGSGVFIDGGFITFGSYTGGHSVIVKVAEFSPVEVEVDTDK